MQNMLPIPFTSEIGESVHAPASYLYVRTTPSFSNPTANIPPGSTSKSHGKAPSSFTTPRRESAPVAASTEKTAMDSCPRLEQYSSLPSAESLIADALE